MSPSAQNNTKWSVENPCNKHGENILVDETQPYQLSTRQLCLSTTEPGRWPLQ